jgi:CO dehydrogenase maturation factor
MAFTIAISGKGGTGKTTLAAFVIKFITEELGKAMLAVDADPNATLHDALGVDVSRTVSDIREETLENKLKLAQSGISKERLIEYEIQESVKECGKFDLITMGRPEGPGCYCYVNNLLRKYLGALSAGFPFTVIDNEAGMEHLSRRTNGSVDLLLVVVEPTVMGVNSARNIYRLSESLPVAVRDKVLILNKVPPVGVHDEVRRRLRACGLPVAGNIPADEEVMEFAVTGKSLLDIPPTNKAYGSVKALTGKYIKAD